MAKFPKDRTLEQDHEFLVAVLTDIRNGLKRAGKITANDRNLFLAGHAEPEMPTTLELLDAYIVERT